MTRPRILGSVIFFLTAFGCWVDLVAGEILRNKFGGSCSRAISRCLKLQSELEFASQVKGFLVILRSEHCVEKIITIARRYWAYCMLGLPPGVFTQ